ncbi:hypothetical protein [Aureibacter tunicatorum]|uniref:Lipid A 3-O-deacylase PagL n=1 Tax=Aureibacter tunicatorum TaxID=866807 RepID=A0AAE4BRV2_9BACT|nr:hypothetical protein [Aureibacter tunicatorum]MDR6239081.1 hypothetical protein [Aureibacter tunicatorum]BDD04993.1 hypothetical protein AUTU_24760 [Aureibacter tunicatorum]
MKYILLHLALSFIFITNASASDSLKTANTNPPQKHSFLKVSFQHANVLKGNDFVEGINKDMKRIEHAFTYEAQWGYQSTGTKHWQQLLNYPFYGFGFWGAHFPTTEIGNPFGVYGFFGGFVKRWNRFNIAYEVKSGIAYYGNPYDPDTNPYNIAIGGYINYFMGVELNFNYMLAEHWDILLGLSASHDSNGMVTVPDFGINLFGPKIGARYRFYRREYQCDKLPDPPLEKDISMYVTFNAGTKQYDDSPKVYRDKANYFIGSLSVAAHKRLTYISSVGGGFDFTYDNSLRGNYKQSVGTYNIPEQDKYSVAFFVSYKASISRFNLIPQIGGYIIRKSIPDEQDPIFFQRVCLQYEITDHIFVSVGLRAYDFSVADFIEWGFGYQFSLTKQK